MEKRIFLNEIFNIKFDYLLPHFVTFTKFVLKKSKLQTILSRRENGRPNGFRKVTKTRCLVRKYSRQSSIRCIIILLMKKLKFKNVFIKMRLFKGKLAAFY